MPSPTVKNLVKKTGRSEQEIERLWIKAKEIARKEKRENDYEYIQGILKKELGVTESYVGKHTETPDSEFDPKQLAYGTYIETEHTDDLEIAKNIAKDHLAEDPDYYRNLKKYVEHMTTSNYFFKESPLK